MDVTLERMLRLRELMKKARGKRQSQEWQQEVDELRTTVAVDLLRRFDHLIDRGRAPVGLLSNSGACESCHLQLTPDQILHMRNAPGAGFTCPYCGCLLYVPFPANTQTDNPLGERRARIH
jgi:predicted  nucleic acid-binding Zn-ribbon protein